VFPLRHSTLVVEIIDSSIRGPYSGPTLGEVRWLWGRAGNYSGRLAPILLLVSPLCMTFVWLTGSVVGVGGAEGVAASRPCPAFCRGKS